MKNKRILFAIIALFFMILLTGGVYAAQPVTLTVKPLQQPIAVKQGATISLCTSLQAIIHDASVAAYTDLNNAARLNQTGVPDIRFTGIDAAYGQCIACQPPENIRNCCQQQQTFTVQDQMAAGCVASDTIQQCLDKLLRQCIKNVTTKDNVKTKLKQDQQKAEAIAAKAKHLSDKLNQLINAIP